MPDQHWKTKGLDKNRFIVAKPGPYTTLLYRRRVFQATDRRGDESRYCHCDRAIATRVDINHAVPCDPNARYFVLRIDCDAQGNPHDPNARVALAAYAASVEAENPTFAADIREWLKETAVPVGAEVRQ